MTSSRSAAVPETILERLTNGGIEFERTPFKGKLRTVDQVAEAVDLPAASIAKALLVWDSARRPIVCTLPGDRVLDLAGLAEQVGTDSLTLVARGAIAELTGVEIGAVTPLLGLVRDDLEILVDTRLLRAQTINVSSGDPSYGISLRPADLLRAVGADVVELEGP